MRSIIYILAFILLAMNIKAFSFLDVSPLGGVNITLNITNKEEVFCLQGKACNISVDCDNISGASYDVCTGLGGGGGGSSLWALEGGWIIPNETATGGIDDVNVTGKFCIAGFCIDSWAEVNISISAIIDTLWNIVGSKYMVNVSGVLDVNETVLNHTIRDAGNDTFLRLDTQNDPLTGDLQIEASLNVSKNLTVGDRINQDDYYIAPCDTNNLIDGKALCIWANATTPLNVPYANFQPGGAGQASYIAGSLMLVNRNQTNLLSVNSTDCAIQANLSGVELKVDCNSTSPTNPLGRGPDFIVFGDSQFTGEFNLRNQEGQWRFFTRELSLRDELYENIFFNDANITIEGNKLVVTDRLNETLVVNIDRSETIFDTVNDSITLTMGTNSSPAVNHITYQNKENPTLTRDAAEPTVEHAEVAILYTGDTTNTTYLCDDTISHNEQFIDQVYDTFGDSGAIYLDKLNPSVSDNQINISDGTVRIRITKHIYGNNVSSDSFFWINSTGEFTQCVDFTCLDAYSSGEKISNNRYYNVIWLVIPDKCSPDEQWLLAIPQNKPGTEHVRDISAEEDVTKVVFFSSNTDFKRTEIPVLRTIHQRTGNNDLVAFPTNNELFQDLRGQIRAGGGSVAPPPITDHNLLNKLEFNESAHTFNAGGGQVLDLGSYSIRGTGVSNMTHNYSHTNYPNACSSQNAVTQIDDTITCTTFLNNPALTTLDMSLEVITDATDVRSYLFGLLTSGSASSPALRWIIDTDTGFFRLGENNIGITAGGITAYNIDKSLMNIGVATIFNENVSFEKDLYFTTPGSGAKVNIHLAGNFNITSLNVSNKATIRELEVSIDTVINGNLTIDGMIDISGKSGVRMDMDFNGSVISYTVTTDNIYNLTVGDLTNVDKLIIDYNGEIGDNFGASTRWDIELHNCTHDILDEKHPFLPAPGVEPMYEGFVGWYIRVIVENPQSNCDYHLKLDEKEGSGRNIVHGGLLDVWLQ